MDLPPFIQAAERVVLAAVAYIDSGRTFDGHDALYDDLEEAVEAYKIERVKAEVEASP